jgi:hypothetical protein
MKPWVVSLTFNYTGVDEDLRPVWLLYHSNQVGDFTMPFYVAEAAAAKLNEDRVELDLTTMKPISKKKGS